MPNRRAQRVGRRSNLRIHYAREKGVRGLPWGYIKTIVLQLGATLLVFSFSGLVVRLVEFVSLQTATLRSSFLGDKLLGTLAAFANDAVVVAFALTIGVEVCLFAIKGKQLASDKKAAEESEV